MCNSFKENLYGFYNINDDHESGCHIHNAHYLLFYCEDIDYMKLTRPMDRMKKTYRIKT